MSRNSSPRWYRSREPASFSSLAFEAASTARASSRGTMTTPSSSPTTTSPGRTAAPAQVTGTLTEPEPLLHRALRGHALGPHRELHRGQFGDVAAAGVDHQPAHPAGGKGGRQQFTEIAVFRGRFGSHHEHVTVLALLDGDVDHPVVVGRQAHGDRGSADPGPGVYRRHVRRDQAGAALRLVNGGDSVLAQSVAYLRVGPVADCARRSASVRSPSPAMASARCG